MVLRRKEGEPLKKVATIGDVRSYENTDVERGRTYRYEVLAETTVGTSKPSKHLLATFE